MLTALTTHRPFRLTVCTLVLSTGLCLASGGAAVAAQRTDPGPSWHQQSVDFAGGVLDYRETESGFDAAGTAYFEQSRLTVGGPEHIRYTTTESHS
ncbi:hypothetical protein [Streptomyces kanamyceticus]|uniref:Uncharacterized protein n=1 Tax=Streptomyces kanamyceticus TaxID=1967 RepID=A0A5J6GIK7_STRKN|nr:hypothetical protein [Streptomyces kanamyceticus]QEU94272.1 hypothetical protein CP970_28210 [Streptomyces kanamyceticus]